MKKHLAIYLVALVAATSCGSTAHYTAAPQQFEDGIYASPGSAAPVAAVSQEEMDALVRESMAVNRIIRLLAVDAVRQLLCQIIASTAAFYFAVESVRIVRRKRKDFGQVHFVVIGK